MASATRTGSDAALVDFCRRRGKQSKACRALWPATAATVVQLQARNNASLPSSKEVSTGYFKEFCLRRGQQSKVCRAQRRAKKVAKKWEQASHSTHLLVSMASVPPRFALLQEAVLGMARQQRPPDTLLLIVAHQYRNFAVSPSAWPQQIARVREAEAAAPSLVRVRWRETDHGPVTKLLGALEYVNDTLSAAMAARTLLVTVDDDIVYPRWLLATLTHYAGRLPHATLALMGGTYLSTPSVPHIERGKGRLKYQHRYAALPDSHTANNGSALLPCSTHRINHMYGWAGVAYRPSFFRSGALHEHVPWLLEDCLACDDQYIAATLRGAGVDLLLVPPSLERNGSALASIRRTAVSAASVETRGQWGKEIMLKIARLMNRFPASIWKDDRRAAPDVACPPNAAEMSWRVAGPTTRHASQQHSKPHLGRIVIS